MKTVVGAIVGVVYTLMAVATYSTARASNDCLPTKDRHLIAADIYAAAFWPALAVVAGMGTVLAGDAGRYACLGKYSQRQQ